MGWRTFNLWYVFDTGRLPQRKFHFNKIFPWKITLEIFPNSFSLKNGSLKNVPWKMSPRNIYLEICPLILSFNFDLANLSLDFVHGNLCLEILSYEIVFSNLALKFVSWNSCFEILSHFFVPGNYTSKFMPGNFPWKCVTENMLLKINPWKFACGRFVL